MPKLSNNDHLDRGPLLFSPHFLLYNKKKDMLIMILLGLICEFTFLESSEDNKKLGWILVI